MKAERERLQQVLIEPEEPRTRWGKDDLQGHVFREGTTKKAKDACWHIETEPKYGSGEMPPNSSAGSKGCRSSPNTRSWWAQATSFSRSWTGSLCCSHQQLMGISEKGRGQCLGCAKTSFNNMKFLGGTGALNRLRSYMHQPYKATPKNDKRDFFKLDSEQVFLRITKH